MKQYQNILTDILHNGVTKSDRTGVGTISVFNVNESFDLKQGFPLVTGKNTSFDNIAKELHWFLSGSTNANDLKEQGCNIWNEWAADDGSLGPIYGTQWRKWKSVKGVVNSGACVVATVDYIDQIANVIHTLKNNPDSRRMIVSAWNVGDLEVMALEPCHYTFQFYTREMSTDWRVDWAKLNILNWSKHAVEHEGLPIDYAVILDELNVPKRFLSCKVIQRSCDAFLGVPYNIASYALLTHLIAHCTNMVPDILHWSGGDTHLYLNHMEQVNQYLRRPMYTLPKLEIGKNCPVNIDDITMKDYKLSNYMCGGHIKAKVAV